MFNKNQGLVKDYVVTMKRSQHARQDPGVVSIHGWEGHTYVRYCTKADIEELAGWIEQGLVTGAKVDLARGEGYVENVVSEHLTVSVGLWAED